MSENKKRKENDKAIRHLIDYIEQSDKWGPLFKVLIHNLCRPVAKQLEADVYTLLPELISGPYGHMAFGYLFEEMATTTWDNEGVTPIDTFLKARGWREAPAGRRYLRALVESSLQLFEITSVEAGKWVEVRPYGTDARSIRVVEHAASQSLHPGGALVARVYPEGKARRFTGAMLPMNPDEAAYVHERLESVPADLAQSYKELVDEGEDVEGISENFADHIPQERMTRLAESAFFCFAIDVLDPPAPVMPQMVNTQDNPEVQALVQTHLMDHYRRTLDEPIPMLDNHTPRACAADPEKRQSVIDWLKYLENITSKTSDSSTDLRWLWTELGLDAYRPKSTTE